MSDESDWSSFWDLTTPADAADLLRAEHGANALQAAALRRGFDGRRSADRS
jgi:hypothetical protein